MLELAQLLMSIAGFGVPLGILMLMSGRVKLRNELDTLVRIISAFCISLVCYWLLGHSFFSGESFKGFIGIGSSIALDSRLFSGADDLRVVFLFSIPPILASAALVERGSFIGGNILSAVVAILVAPVVAHWVWSTEGSVQGWLASLGFADNGGAVVIFGSAGFVSLAVTMSIGPRRGRFPIQEGRPRGHSPTYHALGMILIVFGLAMISAGEATSIGEMPTTLFKVLLGASFAATAALFLLVMHKRGESATDLMTSALAGAIALSAFGPEISTANAALAGLFAGAATIGLRRTMLGLEIDDPGDLIAAFVAGGVIGCLLAPLQSMGNSHAMINQIVMQMISITVICLWSFLIPFIIAQIMMRFIRLRVSDAEEEIGLSRLHFGIQSEPDYYLNQIGRVRSGRDFGEQSDTADSLSTNFSQRVVKLRDQINHVKGRIQATSTDGKKTTAMIARIRMAEDTLKVKAEDILLLLQSVNEGSNVRTLGLEFERWLQQALDILLSPTMEDLDHFTRNLTLQADLEELETTILAAADSMATGAHHVELLGDLADAQSDGFYARHHDCDLSQLLDEQSTSLKALAEIRNSPIQIDCPTNSGLVVQGDSNAFVRILMLAAEAALNRLSSRDGMPVRIELREHSSGMYALLECLDTGAALSARQLRLIRNPLTPDLPLADIGLPQILPLILLVRLVNAIGGEMTLSSEQGLGTLLRCRFRLKLTKTSKASSAA